MQNRLRRRPNLYRVSNPHRSTFSEISFWLGRTKNAGKLAVEEALRLRKVLAVLTAKVKHLEDTIVEDDLDVVDLEMAVRDLDEAMQKVAKSKEALRRKEAALGVDDRHTLRNLVNSAYIQARMNARALKFRLRAKLRARKFELDRVERTFHLKKAGKPLPILVLPPARRLTVRRRQTEYPHRGCGETSRPGDPGVGATL